MGRTAISHEYQDIIEASAGQNPLEEIDVEAQVMERVEQLWLMRNRPTAWKVRLRKPTAMFSLLMVFLLLSVTAYAAAEYIQIRNSRGEVKVKYMEAEPVQQSAHVGNNMLRQQMESKALAFAKPGELIAYYVKENAAEKSAEALKFVHKEQRLTAYTDFSAEIRRTGAPMLPEAPEGYSFQYGNVGPDFPYNSPMMQQELYRETLNELRAQAEQATGEQRLFMKSVPWTSPLSVSAMYAKGGGFLGISAQMMHGGDMMVQQGAEEQAKKITVAGTDVVINTLGIGPDRQHHYLTWYNEEYDAYFLLTSYGDRTLSEEKLLKLVEELLQ
ncbi:hypothetical protein [Paenibacillus donghaensis]|uniref:DUF4367 domain-containing protein n=1 Tax=Paenibacillus donghaensis TaxID=414771 RepID=A0A2Z2KNI1_9BACL|nr:hypothetical protein [Paenibacillus donghaensis]ASA25153.1 hypothetical protein B9T62_33125 [Paenibacillus donghaensis]